MLPKTTLIILICASIFISCSTPKDQDTSSTSDQKKANSENLMKGKIISQTFINKGGKEINTIQDLYFETNKETYFIKFMDSNITYDEAKELLDLPIEIDGEVREGMWDVPDDNPGYAQSRTGFYLVIFSIK